MFVSIHSSCYSNTFLAQAQSVFGPQNERGHTFSIVFYRPPSATPLLGKTVARLIVYTKKDSFGWYKVLAEGSSVGVGAMAPKEALDNLNEIVQKAVNENAAASEFEFDTFMDNAEIFEANLVVGSVRRIVLR